MTSSDINSGMQATRRRRSTKTILSAVALGLMAAASMSACSLSPGNSVKNDIKDLINNDGHAEYLGQYNTYGTTFPISVSVKQKSTGEILLCNSLMITEDGTDKLALFCYPGKPATLTIPYTMN